MNLVPALYPGIKNAPHSRGIRFIFWVSAERVGLTAPVPWYSLIPGWGKPDLKELELPDKEDEI
jgi:hypothetical protein